MESYVAPIILSYIEKYVRDFKPADVQVSLWGGGVTLHNLVLKPEVLQKDVSLPFTLVSGRIHELLISVPWTKIISEPIEVKINTIECVLGITGSNKTVPEKPRHQVVPLPPLYMKGIIRRIVSNISVTIQSLIVKYVHDDIVLSLNVKWLHIESVDAEWKPAFADIDPNNPVVRRLVRLEDCTLCLDKTGSDGRIRHFQEPLLDRCQLTVKLLTTLVSVPCRKAKNVTVEIRSNNLELSVNSDQLLLLIRMLSTRPKPQRIPFSIAECQALLEAFKNDELTVVPPKIETWSEWAWSWLPSWSNDQGEGEVAAPPGPVPILVSAFIDKLALVYKVVETEANSDRKRARRLLELSAAHAAVTYLAQAPTLLLFRAGVRALQLASCGKCACGHVNLQGFNGNPTIYMTSENPLDAEFNWPEEVIKEYWVEPTLRAELANEVKIPDLEEDEEDIINNPNDGEGSIGEERNDDNPQENTPPPDEIQAPKWFNMNPAIFIQFKHERTPPRHIQPYENPPNNFEDSDWAERVNVNVIMRPLTLNYNIGLQHRLMLTYELLQEALHEEPVLPNRQSWQEQCYALLETIPLRMLDVKLKRLEVRLTPSDHFFTEQAFEPVVTFTVKISKANLEASSPLYGKRVCLVGRYMSDDAHPIRHHMYQHVAVNILDVTGHLSTSSKVLNRPIFNGSATLVAKRLLHREVFYDHSDSLYSGEFTITELVTHMTPAAARTMFEVVYSLVTDQDSALLRDTTLAEDAVNTMLDTTAIECILHDIIITPIVTENIYMTRFIASNIKMTAVDLKNGFEGNVGWICSAPDIRTNPRPWMTLTVHMCENSDDNEALEYIRLDMESCAFSLDPLLVRWLAYRPRKNPPLKLMVKISSTKLMSSSKYFLHRLPTPPASSGRSSRVGSLTEYVHGRARGLGSTVERRELYARPRTPPAEDLPWDNDRVLALYNRLRRTLISVNTGGALVYSAASTAGALDTASVREAMERHAADVQRVLVIDTGRFELTSAAQSYWEFVEDDIPSYLPAESKLEQTFPWKLQFTKVSCSTLEASPPSDLTEGERDMLRVRAQARTVIQPMPRNIFSGFNSHLILSIVTKKAATACPRPPSNAPDRKCDRNTEQLEQYFNAGPEFVPSTFSEFMRGPRARPGTSHEENCPSAPSPEPEGPDNRPLVSLGVNVHAESQPIHMTATQDQIHTVRAAMHTFAHMMALLQRPMMAPPKTHSDPPCAPIARLEQSSSSDSESPTPNLLAALIPIFLNEPAEPRIEAPKIKVMFWYQWIITRAEFSFLHKHMKLTLDIEECIATLDVQEKFQKLRFKIATATVYDTKLVDPVKNKWQQGPMGGRVFETGESSDGRHTEFFTGSVFIPRTSNLPNDWKTECFGRWRRSQMPIDRFWEVDACLAPLEIMLRPQVLQAIKLIGDTLFLDSFCPVPLDNTPLDPLPMPLCHVSWGGARITLTEGEESSNNYEDDGRKFPPDDTIVFSFGELKIWPNPTNPICRRSIDGGVSDSGWIPAATSHEGRQHEISVKSVNVKTTRACELMQQVMAARVRSQRQMNPAALWAVPMPIVNYVPLLHNVELNGVFAPPLYSETVLACGPALDLTLNTDVLLEFSSEQLTLLARLLPRVRRALTERDTSMPTTFDTAAWCPFHNLTVLDDEPKQLSNPPDENVVSDSGVVSQHSTHQMEHSTNLTDRVSDQMEQTSNPIEQSSIGEEPTSAPDSPEPKKPACMAVVGHPMGVWNYFEIYMVTGRIDVAFYTRDDEVCDVSYLRPPASFDPPDTDAGPSIKILINPVNEKEVRDPGPVSEANSRSLTETAREADVGKSRLETVADTNQLARRLPNFIPVLHGTFYQPNMYYWQKRDETGLRMSLFDISIAHGEGQDSRYWHMPLLTTRAGVPDPDTDFAPSLFSLEHNSSIRTPGETHLGCSYTNLEVERPLVLYLTYNSLVRLKVIGDIIKIALMHSLDETPEQPDVIPLTKKFYDVVYSKKSMKVRIRTGQLVTRLEYSVVGCESLCGEVATAGLSGQIAARALFTAITCAVVRGECENDRHALLLPHTLGLIGEMSWDMQDHDLVQEPCIRLLIESTEIAVDLRPVDIFNFVSTYKSFLEFINDDYIHPFREMTSYLTQMWSATNQSPSAPPRSPTVDSGTGDVYYKDDLRSGAFKMVLGEEGRLPKAYEVVLWAHSVMWTYPGERSVVRVVASPLPDCNEEVDCVLESYNVLLERWEENAQFKIPVADTITYDLSSPKAEKVYAKVWRIRLNDNEEKENEPFQFDPERFMPKLNPLTQWWETRWPSRDGPAGDASGEQLASAVRVDSFVSAVRAPRVYVAARAASLELHLRNEHLMLHRKLDNDVEYPAHPDVLRSLQGVFTSQSQRRSHRALSLVARDATFNVADSRAGTVATCEMLAGVDVYEPETGTMEPMVDDFPVRAMIARTEQLHSCVAAGDIQININAARVRTLERLYKDWNRIYTYFHTLPKEPSEDRCQPFRDYAARVERLRDTWEFEQLNMEEAVKSLDGRVYLYIINNCNATLYCGQEGTDELIAFPPHTTHTYRWSSPLAPKKLRFTRFPVSDDWRWSKSVSFSEGTHKIRLEDDPEEAEKGACSQADGTYLYVRIEDLGPRRNMHLSGKVVLANLLAKRLSYRVRVRDPSSESADGMRLVAAGELAEHCAGDSVLEATCNTDTYIKIKFADQYTGWTGDIPLKPCPKIVVPWLVKVPAHFGEVPCVSVWCRVERTRRDERVSVVFTPMYTVQSHLPLDVHLTMNTEPMESECELERNPPPLVQTIAGRGRSSQLLVHGTTGVQHNLTFKYSELDCEVTRDSVPLHYKMLDKYVFNKHVPPSNVEDVMADAMQWLNELWSQSRNPWPYTVVREHWRGEWAPAAVQPRCDVTFRYESVTLAGGGCGVVLHVRPRVLFANACTETVMLHAADFTPLCRLEPGTVLVPHTDILTNPFFVLLQDRHETYSSNELAVCAQDPGVYGALEPGQLAPDRCTDVAVVCNDRVALMTMHFNVYNEINVFGVTTSFVFLNLLPFKIMVAPMVVEYNPQKPPVLRPRNYMQVDKTKEDIDSAVKIPFFHLGGPWNGENIQNLRLILCLAAKDNNMPHPAHKPVPVQVGQAAMRRSISFNKYDQLTPVVVTQVRHEGRWLVTTAVDPSPQYLIRNLTYRTLALAQPLRADRAHDNDQVPVLLENTACKWWFTVEPSETSYYSTITHLVANPPLVEGAVEPDGPRSDYLSIGLLSRDMTPEWGTPFAVKEGEQLVQLPHKVNLKVCVKMNPHSTVIELRPVRYNDLSASEIRRRLANSATLPDPKYPPLADQFSSDNKLYEALESAHQCKLVERDLSRASTSKEDEPAEINPIPATEEKVSPALSAVTHACIEDESETSLPPIYQDAKTGEAAHSSAWLRAAASSVTLSLAHAHGLRPLISACADRVAMRVDRDQRMQRTMLSVCDLQVDNPQYESKQFDFAVMVTSSAVRRDHEPVPPLWGTLRADEYFDVRPHASSVVLNVEQVNWTLDVSEYPMYIEEPERVLKRSDICEVELYVGPLSLYVDDEFLRQAAALLDVYWPGEGESSALAALAETRALRTPLRVRRLYLHPLDLTLTLHTAMRVYIGLDKSPLRMTAFRLDNVVTTADRLVHDLTVHYLSGAILGAGWVVGGLELLGAPGSLAARLTRARGGVRDVASAAGAAVLRSVSACAGSLARNLDLLAGDEEHTRRAAIARRDIPPTLLAGLYAGIQIFAVNLLGAVGGLAHHPVVELAVGETSGVAALRRGLVGAIAKPLSATADLVAFAGQGLLAQTGWDPDPQPRPLRTESPRAMWRRDCVRWDHRLESLLVLYGVDAMHDGELVRVVVTDKFLVIAEPVTERIVEMIDFRFCKIISFDSQEVELRVLANNASGAIQGLRGMENTFHLSSAALARVARYTGARPLRAGRSLCLRTRSAPTLAAAVMLVIFQNPSAHYLLVNDTYIDRPKRQNAL